MIRISWGSHFFPCVNRSRTIITQRICTGARGNTEFPLASLKARPTSRVVACAMFSARTWSTNLLILSKSRRPSSTAFRIDAKLSSVRMMSEASLATSLPAWPCTRSLVVTLMTYHGTKFKDRTKDLCNRGSYHGNTNICPHKRGRIVDSVTSHSSKPLPAVQSIDHPDFRLGRTTCNDTG